MNCKNNIDNFCNHYKKAAPPENICFNCRFFEEKEPDILSGECMKNMYSDNWCLFIDNDGNYEWINRLNCNSRCKYAELD